MTEMIWLTCDCCKREFWTDVLGVHATSTCQTACGTECADALENADEDAVHRLRYPVRPPPDNDYSQTCDERILTCANCGKQSSETAPEWRFSEFDGVNVCNERCQQQWENS